MGIWQINRTYRNLQRMQAILNVLLKHGFGQLIRQLGLHRMLPLGKQASVFRSEEGDSTIPMTLPIRFRLVLEELGPTFIKFGQVLSSRPDVIPGTFVVELEKLQEDVTPLPFSTIKQIVTQEIDDEFESVFIDFDTNPMAAASIAQVHSAKLQSGEEVVVKVMRPGIEKAIRNDLDILYALANLVEKHIQELERYDPVGIVKEFERTINQEIDFTIEAVNTEKFGINFADEPTVVIPKVFWKYTSKKILILQKIKGVSIGNIKKLQIEKFDRRQIAEDGMRIFLQQVLKFGFFHADPHPGNILVLDNGQIALIDFGMVGRIDRSDQENLSLLIVSLLEQNYDKMLLALQDLHFKFEDETAYRLKRELRDLVETYYGLPLKKIGFADIVSRLIKIMSQYGIEVPIDFLMLSRAMVIIEGVVRQLDPTIDIIEIGSPMLKEILKQRSDPRNMFNESLTTIWEIRRMVRALPAQVHGLFRKIITGKLQFGFSHTNLTPLYREIERLGNRIAFGLIAASLILASSIIIMAEKGPTFLGYPALGVVGYVMAGIITFILIFSVLRSGRF